MGANRIVRSKDESMEDLIFNSFILKNGDSNSLKLT